MYFVYILECRDKTLYIGSTNNLEARISAHNKSKRGARYTKSRRPVALRYHEKFRSKSKALKREHKLKTFTRKEKLNLIES